MNCKKCKWAKWQFDSIGRVMNKPGTCTVEFVITDAPYSVTMSSLFNASPGKNAIWPSDEFDFCPKYEEKPKGENP